ncbi:MAG: ferredoxin family protein [Nitrospirae bacterium]|nr:ferredoxin family protein [Nitrospirota bacterium]
MKGKISIDTERCKGCEFCVVVCPKGVIGIKEEFNSSGYYYAYPEKPDDCTGCAFCADACPDVAIEVWKEDSSEAL